MTQETLAETLYEAAVDLIRSGNYEDACPKLEQSHDADPAGGTVLLLAICYEKVGKTASAWIKFKDALAMARADRRADREQRAEEHLARLEPRLSRVTVTAADPIRKLPGFSLQVDGAAIPTTSTSWTIPLDPGDHLIRAEAAERLPWSTTVTLTGDSARETVVVPELDPVPPAAPQSSVAPVEPPPTPRPSPAPPPATPPETAVAGRQQRAVGVVVGSVGLAMLGVGSYFGVRALRQNDQARDRCPDTTCADPEGVALSDDAWNRATQANVLFAVGGTTVAAGAILYLSAPRREGAVALGLSTTPGGAVMSATGRF